MAQRTCSVEGCDLPHLALSFCKKHYRSFKRFDDPLQGLKRYQVFDATHKLCSDCGETKLLTDFSPAKATSSGRQSYCRRCQCVRAKRSRAKWTLEQRAARAAYERRQKARKNYGLSATEYDQLHAGDACHVCGAPGSGRWRRLHIDHDHQTGAVRGLLCHECNTALGLAREDPNRLRALAAYLEVWR